MDPFHPKNEKENLAIDREILEAVRSFTSSIRPFATATNVCSKTSLGTIADGFSEFKWRTERLEKQGLVQIEGRNLAGDFSIALKPEGKYRLSMIEDEYRKSLQHGPAIHNQVTVHGEVRNFGQSFGSNSPITQYTEDSATLGKLFERLLSEIKDNPTTTSVEKLNAEIEAQQLQLELKKSTPSTDKIKSAVSFLVAYAPLVIDLMKPYLPMN